MNEGYKLKAKQLLERHLVEYKTKINEKAREFCDGEFTVTKEYEALEQSRSSAGIGTGFGFGGGSSILIGGAGPSQTMYQFVEFKCN